MRSGAASARTASDSYPAMPYPYYTKMSREDVLAIRAYLKTLEPVRNPVQPGRSCRWSDG